MSMVPYLQLLRQLDSVKRGLYHKINLGLMDRSNPEVKFTVLTPKRLLAKLMQRSQLVPTYLYKVRYSEREIVCLSESRWSK